MMSLNVVFHAAAWEDFQYWIGQDRTERLSGGFSN